MNSTSSLTANPSGSQVTRPKISPLGQCIGRCTVSLGFGALLGYAVYGITRLAADWDAIKGVDKATIRPIPYVLCGVISMAIIEGARIVHDLALYLLGERKKVENLDSTQASMADRLRKK